MSLATIPFMALVATQEHFPVKICAVACFLSTNFSPTYLEPAPFNFRSIAELRAMLLLAMKSP